MATSRWLSLYDGPICSVRLLSLRRHFMGSVTWMRLCSALCFASNSSNYADATWRLLRNFCGLVPHSGAAETSMTAFRRPNAKSYVVIHIRYWRSGTRIRSG